jgi:chemotaxis signal transduction protein
VSAAAGSLATRAADLRLAFDRSFAEPPRAKTEAPVDLLAIYLGAQAFALRLSEITGLFAGKAITRVPGGAAALLGIASFRGTILPVYDLQNLLGRGVAAKPRWLAVAAAAPAAFAFETFAGQLRAAPDSILRAQIHGEERSCTRDVAQLDGRAYPLIHLPAVLDAITT